MFTDSLRQASFDFALTRYAQDERKGGPYSFPPLCKGKPGGVELSVHGTSRPLPSLAPPYKGGEKGGLEERARGAVVILIPGRNAVVKKDFELIGIVGCGKMGRIYRKVF